MFSDDVSVIIPACNEEESIGPLVSFVSAQYLFLPIQS